MSYLLGSIPFGYLLVRFFRGEDVRQSGSGNTGATNVSRKSPALGAITLLLDSLKGAAAVILAYVVDEHMSAGRPMLAHLAVGALFAVLGHMFPVWLNFRGGKGVATGLGAFALLAPKAVLVAAAIFIAVALLSHYVSLGSIVAVTAFPFLAWSFDQFDLSPAALTLMAITSLVIVVKHHENIRRLLAGDESRIRAKQP